VSTDAEDWFAGWVKLHCVATGADAAAARTLLANRDLMTGHWRATAAELGEVTTRLVAGMRVPKFANEHTDAVGGELHHLRQERASLARPAPPGDFPPACRACGGSGLATVPLVDPRRPSRSFVEGRRLVLAMGYKAVPTMAAVCDEPGCVAGPRVKGRGMYVLSWLNAHYGCDLVGLLREHERGQARAARTRPAFRDGSGGVWDDLVASLRAKAA
jgi:hypothetical protein